MNGTTNHPLNLLDLPDDLLFMIGDKIKIVNQEREEAVDNWYNDELDDDHWDNIYDAIENMYYNNSDDERLKPALDLSYLGRMLCWENLTLQHKLWFQERHNDWLEFQRRLLVDMNPY